MSTNATLAECCELIDEMRTIYSSPDDAVAVREARGAFGGLRGALDQRQGSLAASIRGAPENCWRPDPPARNGKRSPAATPGEPNLQRRCT
jgi:hypothetical protein